jgi:beta-lactamase regulating signal transducer with metallopeptidase domain
MYNLAYSIVMTLLHSVWQMALLLLLYFAITFLFNKWPPLAKRNLLLSSISLQVLCSIITFIIIFSGASTELPLAAAGFSWLTKINIIPQHWFSYLLLVYTAGLGYKLLASFVKWKNHLRLLQTDLQKAPVTLRIFTDQKALAFGIQRKVQVWLSDKISSPLTYGFFKPVILFPVALCSQLTVAQTEALIVHELTHIRTKDYLLNWMLVITEALYFFNPFVKIAAGRIRLEREKNCDVTVIDFNYSGLHYAEALLQIAKNNSAPFQLSMAAVQHKNELLKRIQYFSAVEERKKNRINIWPGVSLMLGLIIFLNLALFNLINGKSFRTVYDGKFPIVLHMDTGSQDSNKEAFASFFAMPVNPATASVALESEAASPVTAALQPKPVERRSTTTTTTTETTITEDNIPAPASYFQNVAFASVAAPEVKQMIVTEENSSGEKVTRSYIVTIENGEWKIQPQWIYTEKMMTDSLKAAIKSDSTVYRVFPTVQ